MVNNFVFFLSSLFLSREYLALLKVLYPWSTFVRDCAGIPPEPVGMGNMRLRLRLGAVCEVREYEYISAADV